MAGFFISFEGGEGSGKTTQIELLANWLQTNWPRGTTKTREPGGTKGAEAIRALLVTGEGERWDSTTEALLMTASRRDNLQRIIKPALARGDVVLTDRFHDSTAVYQGAVGGAASDLITALNTLCLDNVLPDVTILLDIDPDLGLGRSMRDGNKETRFESKGAEFHHAVRQAYCTLAAANPQRFMVIDASQNEKQIHELIIGHLKPLLQNRAKA